MKEQIIKLMEAEGLTPAKFADAIGVQRSSISHILSERNKPSYDFILKILEKFQGINAEWLLTGKGTMIKSLSSGMAIKSKEPTLFDKTNNLEISGEKTIHRNSDLYNQTITKNITEEKEKTKGLSKSEEHEKDEEKGIFTDVNNIKYIIIFYNDNTFERYSKRK